MEIIEIKKGIYYMLTIVFGLLLALIVCTLLIPVALKYQFANLQPDSHNWLYVLPWWIRYTLGIVGAAWGYRLGKNWWRIVYIEKRHWKFKKTGEK